MRIYRLYYSKATSFVLMFGDELIWQWQQNPVDFRLENLTYICKVVVCFKKGEPFNLDYAAIWRTAPTVHNSNRWQVYRRLGK